MKYDFNQYCESQSQSDFDEKFYALCENIDPDHFDEFWNESFIPAFIENDNIEGVINTLLNEIEGLDADPVALYKQRRQREKDQSIGSRLGRGASNVAQGIGNKVQGARDWAGQKMQNLGSKIAGQQAGQQPVQQGQQAGQQPNQEQQPDQGQQQSQAEIGDAQAIIDKGAPVIAKRFISGVSELAADIGRKSMFNAASVGDDSSQFQAARFSKLMADQLKGRIQQAISSWSPKAQGGMPSTGFTQSAKDWRQTRNDASAGGEQAQNPLATKTGGEQAQKKLSREQLRKRYALNKQQAQNASHKPDGKLFREWTSF